MGRDKKTGKRTPPSRPREVVKAELLADPQTKRIADNVKMELNAYVELVLDYAYNPDKKVMVNVVPDEQLKAMGYDSPSGEDVGKWLRGAMKKIADKIQGKSVVEKTDFKASTGARSVLDVPPLPTGSNGKGHGTVDENLLKEVKKKPGPKG